MAYEFELELKNLAIDALQHAHEDYMFGDMEARQKWLKKAASAITAIERLGISADTPRYLWVGRLTCDWLLLDSWRFLKTPKILTKIYEDCRYVICPESWVLNRDSDYLPPDTTSLLEFYEVSGSQADALAEDLEQAIAVYGQLTGGGGAGIDLLYRAELALQRGQKKLGIKLAEQAKVIGNKWVGNHAERLLKKSEEIDTKEATYEQTEEGKVFV